MVPLAGTNIKKLVVRFGIICVQYAQRKDVHGQFRIIYCNATTIGSLLALSWEVMAFSSCIMQFYQRERTGGGAIINHYNRQNHSFILSYVRFMLGEWRMVSVGHQRCQRG